jgi:alcohol dehydrogenase class IV
VSEGAFTWRDGERIVRFGADALADAPRLLEQTGFGGYVLLTTARAAAQAPQLAAGAAAMLHVPPGRVDEVSAGLLGEVGGGLDPAGGGPLDPAGSAPLDPAGGAALAEAGGPPLVALGGGRVVDTAKAIAGARGGRCAAVPTTLSGAEMTPFHRTPAGAEGARLVRPALVIADPALMASAPPVPLAATAMNALAHAMEALYTPLANPVGELAALRAAELIGDSLPKDPPDRGSLALGALLAGYASGAAGIAVHHALCQSIVRTAGTSHAETNAVVLPHSARLMAGRAPAALGSLALALGDPTGDPAAAPAAIARLAARSGHTRLATLGVNEDHFPAVIAATLGHPALANTPDPPGEEELLELLRAAF